MTNKESYQRAFASLQVSKELLMEEKILSHKKRLYISRFAVTLVVPLLLMASASAVYASNLGGIQRVMQVWIHGDQTTVTFNLDEGTYRGTYQNKDGVIKEFAGGGVATNPDGSIRPVNEEELLDYLNSPYVEYEDDNTIWLYYYNQAMEITDMFSEDGICFVLLQHEGETRYVTVKKHGGIASSPRAYIQPYEFN